MPFFFQNIEFCGQITRFLTLNFSPIYPPEQHFPGLVSVKLSAVEASL